MTLMQGGTNVCSNMDAPKYCSARAFWGILQTGVILDCRMIFATDNIIGVNTKANGIGNRKTKPAYNNRYTQVFALENDPNGDTNEPPFV
ncbi:MAG: hypothetical protein Q3Y08_07260 [Butyricicoccus sp.]|nr:hypothetical protein [Butyricicoccus sp.]